MSENVRCDFWKLKKKTPACEDNITICTTLYEVSASVKDAKRKNNGLSSVCLCQRSGSIPGQFRVRFLAREISTCNRFFS